MWAISQNSSLSFENAISLFLAQDNNIIGIFPKVSLTIESFEEKVEHFMTPEIK